MNEHTNLDLLLVGGGTGGHIFPLLAIADEIISLSPQKKIHFIIAKNNSDRYIVEGKYSYTQVPVAKLRRYFSWQNFTDFFRFIYNIINSIFLLKKLKPRKILSKGGFVSLPIGIAAKVLNIPVFLHETDSVMGLSNRILSKISTKILTGFKSSNPNHIFVGNPVRKEFFEKWNGEHRVFSGKKGMKKIFIFGGSQGSLALNIWARSFFPKKQDIEVVLVTGKNKKGNKKYTNIIQHEFLQEDFIQAIKESDLVITRSGGSVSELAAAKKAVVLVPLPSAANNHQRKNAQYFSNKNAAVYVEESELEQKENEILQVLYNEKKLKDLEQNISALSTKKTIPHIINILGV